MGGKAAWGRDVGATAVLAVLMLASLGAMLVLVPESRGLGPVTGIIRMVAGVLMLLGAVLFYLWWRVTRRPEPAWLVAATAYLSAQTLVNVALTVSHHPNVVARPGWLALSQLLAALIPLGMVAAARRTRLRADPLLLGLTTAIIASASQLAILWGPGPLGLSTGALGLVVGAVVVTYVAIGLVVARLPILPGSARRAIAAVTGLFAVGHLGGAPIGLDSRFTLVAACALLAAGLGVVTAASALLQDEWTTTRQDVGFLSRQLEQVELDGRENRAKLHEVRATLAGITTASQLLHDRDAELDEATRVRLQRTVRSEMARLQRLMEDRQLDGPTAVDLDATLDPVLEAHRARGHRVHWRPSGGRRVHARQDDVAEAVNILLENAAKHAKGRNSRVGVAPDGDDLLISVTDSGPGIPARLHHQIFDWGVRGDGSTGQGIGLYVARRLVSEQGGSLTVTTPPGNGTTFTIRLPAAGSPEENHDPHHRLST